MKVTFPETTPDTPIGSSAPTARDTFGRANTLLDDEVATEETDGDEPEDELDDELDPEPDPTPATETSEVDPLIEEAEHYGFSKEDALALGDKLPAVFAQLDRQAAALVRKQMGDAEPAPAAEPAAKTPEPAPSELFKPLESIKLELDAADYDEPMLKQLGAFEKTINAAVERINEHQKGLSMIAEAVLETHGGLTKITTATQSESAAKFADDMDAFFAGQAPELKATFGAVPMGQLTPGSAEVTARQKLVEEMRILEAGDQHFGRPARTPQQYAARALRVLHGEKVHAAARKDVEGKLTARRKQSIAPPSGRNKQLAPFQRATAVVAEKLAAMGLN